MKRKIIVSGAAGFIGSTFVRLHKQLMPDVEIIQVDPLMEGSDLGRIDPDSLFIESTLGNALADMKDSDVSHIFAFGALSSVDYCIENPLAAFLCNVQDVYSALAELKNFTKKPKLIYVSTDEVGGQLPYHEYPWHPEVGTKSALDMDGSQVITHNPRNPYSASKAAAEMLVKGMCTQYGIPFAITRCVNNFGHNQGGGKFIPNIIDAIENDRPIPIRGSTALDVMEHYRCWVAVEQHCAAVLETGYGAINGEVRHVGGDKLKNIDLIKTISEQLGKPYKLALSPAREAHDVGYQLHDISYSECVVPGTIHTYFKKG